MDRKKFLKSVSVPAALAFLPVSASFHFRPERKDKGTATYIGTYTKSGAEGIYLCKLDHSTGRLMIRGVAKDVKDPSFLTTDPRNRILYAASEVGEFNGNPGGYISAFRISRDSGELAFMNSQGSGGAHPCHLITSKNGKYVLAGNYSGGSLCILPVNTDGSLQPLSQIIQHTGSGPNLRRQKSPHVHSVMSDRSGRNIFVADLGTDEVVVYPFDQQSGTVDIPGAKHLKSSPGAGPRHMAMAPDEKFFYVINELHSTITCYAYGNSADKYKEVQTISTLPDDFKGENTCAEIVIHPSGRYLYGSNRGHDSITVFTRDVVTGLLSTVEIIPSGGKNPRNFNITPDGQFLLIANQSTNNIVSYGIDTKTGKLKSLDETLEIPSPVCILFL